MLINMFDTELFVLSVQNEESLWNLSKYLFINIKLKLIHKNAFM